MKILLPRIFISDRNERELPCGNLTSTKNRTLIECDVTDEELADILSDAQHYSHEDGPDILPRGLKTSAKRTVEMITAFSFNQLNKSQNDPK